MLPSAYQLNVVFNLRTLNFDTNIRLHPSMCTIYSGMVKNLLKEKPKLLDFAAASLYLQV